ncbi:helix-turn-helix domain-containing protein [Nocardioides gilvus]|uniref:helix-turn-helix domain-containing protein n=1 Tax=Nocardioides gilvus TaxID=1735589 RepID=UPI000D74E152|nr:XRE family transcriptional regulator [Nocardioides gilvus]
MDEQSTNTVASRLRAIRTHRNFTLTEIAARTGISLSTLSRLESGARKPTLELLVPLARLYDVSLDSLAGATKRADPRVKGKPFRRGGMTFVPVSEHTQDVAAFKVTIPVQPRKHRPSLKVHPGHDWFYVLSGQIRLYLGEEEHLFGPGEVAEFDTLTPHAFTAAGNEPAEVLHLMGRAGERVHVRELG